MSPLLQALTRNGARTDARSPDPALRGRTYAIAFHRVWEAAVELVGADRGPGAAWILVEADDRAGRILAEAVPALRRAPDDVLVRVGLDPNGQTRVDVDARARSGRPDLGRNRRRIRAFLLALDARLSARPTEILDPRRTADFGG